MPEAFCGFYNLSKNLKVYFSENFKIKLLIKFLVVKSLINIIETTGGLILVKVIGKYLILY